MFFERRLYNRSTYEFIAFESDVSTMSSDVSQSELTVQHDCLEESFFVQSIDSHRIVVGCAIACGSAVLSVEDGLVRQAQRRHICTFGQRLRSLNSSAGRHLSNIECRPMAILPEYRRRH
jgi:hypothetical protein